MLFALDVTDPLINAADISAIELCRSFVGVFNHQKSTETNNGTGNPISCYSDDDYSEMKALPTSWSVPYVGRLNVNSSLSFPAFTLAPNDADPVSYEIPPPSVNYGASDRWFAFAGGGYKSTNPAISSQRKKTILI